MQITSSSARLGDMGGCGASEQVVLPPVTVDANATRVEWDAFVADAPDATFFHSAAWRDVLEGAFGFRSHFLAARRGRRIVGVLPLCELRPPFGRPRLLSLPFAVEAGISAAEDDARLALEASAVDLSRAIGACYLELRDGTGGDGFRSRGDVFCRFRRTLGASDEDDLARVPRKRRRMIRLAQSAGLRAEVGHDIGEFHALYARSQRRLGIPLLPREYFAALDRHFGADCIVLTVRRGSSPIASVFSFLFRDAIYPYYAGSHESYLSLGNNDFLYWELMRWARARGLRRFDFGRSRRGSGAYDYKRHWGFEAEPLHYRIRSFGETSPNRRTVDDAGIRLLRWGWRRLPLGVTKGIGPFLARRFAPYFT